MVVITPDMALSACGAWVLAVHGRTAGAHVLAVYGRTAMATISASETMVLSDGRTAGGQGGFLPPSRRGIKVDGLIAGWDCEMPPAAAAVRLAGERAWRT